MDKKRQALVQLYAKNLVEVALETDSLIAIYQDSQDLSSVFADNPNLEHILASDGVSQADKQAIFAIFQKDSSPYMANLLSLLLENNRQGLLSPILAEVLEQLSQVTGQFDLEVTSAVALSDQQKERLISLVQDKFAIKSRKLIETIDEDLIGGFVIKANNKVIDTSIRRQLQDLKMNLK